MLDGTDACPMGSLRQNDFPFKLGARARGTNMANARGSGFAGEGGNDVAVANSGSRFYGEIDEAMVEALLALGADASKGPPPEKLLSLTTAPTTWPVYTGSAIAVVEATVIISKPSRSNARSRAPRREAARGARQCARLRSAARLFADPADDDRVDY